MIFIDTKKPKQSIHRGTLERFKVSFFEDSSKTVPIIPVDATKYPEYSIIDINGIELQSGVGVQDGLFGNWLAEYQVPIDASLSTADMRWKIKWLMVSNKNKNHELEYEFDVIDNTVDIAKSSRELQYIAMENTSFQLEKIIDLPPASITLTLALASDQATKILDEVAPEYRISNGKRIYYFRIPQEYSRAGTYTALWTMEYGDGMPPLHEFQKIIVIPWVITQFFPSLRILIDRYQKRVGTVQAYEDSDIYEFLAQGISLLNSWSPPSNYEFKSLPLSLTSHWIMLSGIWGLNSQHLLEGDLQFSFSGQSISLDYDRTGMLDSAISRMSEFINTNLTNSKTSVKRSGGGATVGGGGGSSSATKSAIVGVRPLRYRNTRGTSRVFKTSGTSSGQDYMSLLTSFGLI